MKIGIFGGSFDPIHFGHLMLAEQAREQCNLDKVYFVPAATPPHKISEQRADDKHRLEMLHLATAGHDKFEVSTIEIDRGGVSFTVDTLGQFCETFPSADLFFVMGADSLDDFSTWREPSKICDLATPIVFERPGAEAVQLEKFADFANQEKLTKIKDHKIDFPQMDLSSTRIRNAIKAKQSIRFQTPRAVELYIQTSKLYK